jgi:RNA 2',3'-cyclic 3'-phosphodiesterase
MASADRDPASHARLFIGLWPGPEACLALQAWSRPWLGAAATQRVPAQRLHLTLHFLGDVPSERLPALQSALALPVTPFVLSLGRAALWPGGIAVLEPERLPSPLIRLHGAIGETLQRLALPTQARPFRPHVTLARRAGTAAAPATGPRIRWPVRGFALVESHAAPGGGYRILQNYG